MTQQPADRPPYEPPPAYGPPSGPAAPGPQSPYAATGNPVDPYAGTTERTWAILSHLAPLIAGLVSAGTLSWLGPLVLWIVYKDRSPLVRQASASSFNFNITVWLATVVGGILCFTVILLPVGIALIAAAWIAQIVFSIKGAFAANRNEIYRYPFQVPILT